MFSQIRMPCITRVLCSTSRKPQDSVISQPKSHALYLIIHLNNLADPVACLKSVAKLKSYVDVISPVEFRDESDEILAGVGFGPNFLARVYPEHNAKGVESFPYVHRKGPHGEMPATGGDIFIHAKSNERGKLFQLAKAIIDDMPEGSVGRFEDIYGWVYKYGRDLSGFIDGTENPADDDDRIRVAVNESTGGSYVITQKWVHKFGVIDKTKERTMEEWIGRTRSDSIELKKKARTSHVYRMDPRLDNSKQAKEYEIVRQSQPFGCVSGEAGLFFIAYASRPKTLDWMLDQMTGAGAEDNLSDDVMRLSECKTGAYFYMPSESELSAMLLRAGKR